MRGAGRTLKAARAVLHFWRSLHQRQICGSGNRSFRLHRALLLPELPHQRREGLGKGLRVEHLAEIFLSLQAQGAHNINLVTPGQWRPGLIAALTLPGQ